MKTLDHTEPRVRPSHVVPMRPSSRDGLYALASAWQASGGTVHPFVRPDRPDAARATSAFDRPEPPYLPDGPSAA